MTWRGHEFLDQVRQDTVWNKVKGAAREKGLDLSMDVVVSIAKTVIGSMPHEIIQANRAVLSQP